jgi:hypothetical protein
MVNFTIQSFLKKHWEVLPCIFRKLLHGKFYHTFVKKHPMGIFTIQCFLKKHWEVLPLILKKLSLVRESIPCLL